MRHRAVEVIIKKQFKIPHDVEIEVTFLYLENGNYHFDFIWYSEDNRHRGNIILPHFHFHTKNMCDITAVLRNTWRHLDL